MIRATGAISSRRSRVTIRVPGSDKIVAILAGAGHWLGEERPDEVNAALLEFGGWRRCRGDVRHARVRLVLFCPS
jgi:hypothetical protein